MPNQKRIKSVKKVCSVSDIELKSITVDGNNEHHLRGFVSAPYVDSVGDFIPEALQSKIVDRINKGFANRVSYNHDFILEGNPLPVASGRAELKKHPKLDLNAAWVDVVLDQEHPKFQEILDNKDTLRGFSIEYLEDFPHHHEYMNGDTAKVFDDIPIFGFSIVGGDAVPVNPMATVDDGFEYKAYFNINEKGEKTMNDTKEKVEVKAEEGEEAPAEEKEESTEEAPAEEPAAEEEKEEAPAAEGKAEILDVKEVSEFKAWKEKQAKSAQMKSFQSAVKDAVQVELKGMNMPYLNPESKFEEGQPAAFESELNDWRQTIEDQTKIKAGAPPDIDRLYDSAARLHNALDESGEITRQTLNGQRSHMKAQLGFTDNTRKRALGVAGKASQNLQIFGGEYKAQLEHDTTKVSDADYYQNAAELQDIYDPIIVSHLNDKTTLWGLMRKKDVSNIGSDRYGFRFWRTRVEGAGGDTSNYNFDEGDALTGYHAKMLKAQAPFMQYGVTVQVSGFTIAQARGSIGDVFAKQVQRATADLLKGINVDLFGTAVGFSDGGKITGLEVFGDDGGTYANLYGHARSTYTTLQGTDAAQTGTPNIDKPLLRTAIRTPEVNGANRNELMIVTDPVQRDKILGLLDPAQRFNSTSARAGFEGMPTFDGIPIHADPDCNDGYVYVIPTRAYFAAVLKAPSFEDLAKTNDSKKGFIKTYFAVVCENPNYVYKITGLGT